MRKFLTFVLPLALAALVFGQTYDTPGVTGGTSWNAPVAFGSIPACSTSVFFQPLLSNHLYDYAYCNGASTLTYHRGGINVTPPVSGDFSWFNQDGATVTTLSDGGIFLEQTGNSADEVHIRYKSAPTPPYTITIGFIPSFEAANNHGGLIFGEAATSVWETNSLKNGSNEINIYRWGTANASWTTTVETNARIYLNRQDVVWLRIQDNNTNRIHSYSLNGETWYDFYSVARTTSLTADRVGFYVGCRDASLQSGITLISWREE